jgi:hypothetical protein
MPADQPNIGMGRRRQGDTEADRTDDRNRTLEREIDEEAGLEAADSAWEPGKEPGAHGATSPHRNVKPGTQSTLDDA